MKTLSAKEADGIISDMDMRALWLLARAAMHRMHEMHTSDGKVPYATNRAIRAIDEAWSSDDGHWSGSR